MEKNNGTDGISLMRIKIKPRATISLIVGGLMLFGILGTILGNGDDAKKPLAVGDAIPEITLQGSDGKTHALHEVSKNGEALILAWIPKTFTPG